MTDWEREAHAAERELAAVRADLAEAQRERDEREAGARWQYEKGKGWRVRALAAEAALAETCEALDKADTELRGQAVDDALAYVEMREELLPMGDPLAVLADAVQVARRALASEGGEETT